MRDFDKTIQPQMSGCNSGADDVTMPGKRDRKPDGRFAAGDLIMNRYKVLAELGQGGMGVVYKCFDEIGGIEVALKALPPELSHNTLEMEDIKDNFQLVSKLVHQNIAISKNLEKDDSNGNYYLIMECVEGEDLRCWIRRKRRCGNITIDDILPIVKQVADALDYAHEQKIIHRDIKPGNIMINSAGKIKVLDFGLAAQIHTSMTRVSMAYHGTSGTGPYMAPEQWRGRAQGAPADQYALAVMTYEMLAGHLPFESPDAAILKQAVLDEIPENISDISKSVQNAINRAMSKEPAARFENCSDFAAALGNKKIKAENVQKKSSFPKWAAILLIAILLGGGAGYYFFDQHRKEQKRRQEQLAREQAEKERLAQEKAENERLAKEKAEKERLEKIAREKAENERLDKENAALKIQLDDKVAEIYRKNYDPAQTFGEKIREMRNAFAVAQGARLLSTANKEYKRANELADWLLTNGKLRDNAKKLKLQAERNRNAIEKYEPAFYAGKHFSDAEQFYQNAEKFYNEAKFGEAIRDFGNAARIFQQAANTAFGNKLQFLTSEARKAEQLANWTEVKIWAEKIRPLDVALSNQFFTAADNGLKKDAVKKELVSARRAKDKKDWQRVIDYAVAALKIDGSCSEAESLKQEAEGNLKTTLEIIATIDGEPVAAEVFFREGMIRSAGTVISDVQSGFNSVVSIYAEKNKSFYFAEKLIKIDARGKHTVPVKLEKFVYSDTKALEYLKKALHGNLSFQNDLGYNYQYGKGVEKDLTKAVYWYRKAADQGYAMAQYNLGVCYAYGRGVTQDYTEAVNWYRKAAEQGYPDAQNNLGFCYGVGNGVAKDYAEAMKWYRKAAEQGYVMAQNNLANYYYNGYGVTQDYNQAVYWYRKAAEKNYVAAQFNLGKCYYNGNGVVQDYNEAVNWYRKAAEQGDADAQNSLGVCYYSGKGTKKDYQLAAFWFKRSAEQGNAVAQNNLGECYRDGEGVEKDLTKARLWFEKSAAQGNAGAQGNLTKLNN